MEEEKKQKRDNGKMAATGSLKRPPPTQFSPFSNEASRTMYHV